MTNNGSVADPLYSDTIKWTFGDVKALFASSPFERNASIENVALDMNTRSRRSQLATMLTSGTREWSAHPGIPDAEPSLVT